MIAFQIVFFAALAAMPYLFWPSAGGPEIDWNIFSQKLLYTIQAQGHHLGCADSEVLAEIRALCKQSARQLKDDQTDLLEINGTNLTYSCEVFSNNLIVVRHLKQELESSQQDIRCSASEAQLKFNPGYHFNFKGQLVSLEFDSRESDRQRVDVKNCRNKLRALIKKKVLPQPEDLLIQNMPSSPGDPKDIETANRVCLRYDIAAPWWKFRKTL